MACWGDAAEQKKREREKEAMSDFYLCALDFPSLRAQRAKGIAW